MAGLELQRTDLQEVIGSSKLNRYALHAVKAWSDGNRRIGAVSQNGSRRKAR